MNLTVLAVADDMQSSNLTLIHFYIVSRDLNPLLFTPSILYYCQYAFQKNTSNAIIFTSKLLNDQNLLLDL